MTLTLQTDRCYEALDLWRFESLWLSLLLWQRSLDNVLTYIVFFTKIVQLPNLAYTLWTKSPGDGGVGESGNLLLSFLHNDKVQYTQVAVHNTAPYRLSSSLTFASWTETAVAFG